MVITNQSLWNKILSYKNNFKDLPYKVKSMFLGTMCSNLKIEQKYHYQLSVIFESLEIPIYLWDFPVDTLKIMRFIAIKFIYEYSNNSKFNIIRPKKIPRQPYFYFSNYTY
jgi:hypothetical protein